MVVRRHVSHVLLAVSIGLLAPGMEEGATEQTPLPTAPPTAAAIDLVPPSIVMHHRCRLVPRNTAMDKVLPFSCQP